MLSLWSRGGWKGVRGAFVLGGAMVTVAAGGVGQITAGAKGAALTGGVAATRAQMERLRDDFVKATRATGVTCSIAPPTIVVEDVPTYGSYDPDRNTLTTSTWDQLTEAEKGGFYRLAGAGAVEDAARKEFEVGAHHWVFVHELGHWWEQCRHVSEEGNHYAYESGANRVAAAYWRERDPSVIAHQRAVFTLVLSRLPNPVPEGQSAEAYFNAHYPDKFGSVREYIRFQAQMCLAVFEEKPAPTFAGALKQTVP